MTELKENKKEPYRLLSGLANSQFFISSYFWWQKQCSAEGNQSYLKTFWNCDILVYSSRNCRLDWILQNVTQRFESSMKYSYMYLLSLCLSLRVRVCLLYGHMIAQWHTFNFQNGSDHCNTSIKIIATLYRNKINFTTRQFEETWCVTNYIFGANDSTGLKIRWQPALSHETWRNEDLRLPLVCINLNDARHFQGTDETSTKFCSTKSLWWRVLVFTLIVLN